jgi:hypothetical protein
VVPIEVQLTYGDGQNGTIITTLSIKSIDGDMV